MSIGRIASASSKTWPAPSRQHPQLIAWQIDNSLGGNYTEASFNEDTRRDWHGWLEAKYETIERLND